MQVQSKNTLSINDLLGTKTQGGDAEVQSQNIQDGGFDFSELLGKTVSENNTEEVVELVAEDINENVEEKSEGLKIDPELMAFNKKEETTSSEINNSKNINIDQLLNNNKNSSGEINTESKETSMSEKGLLAKTGLKLQGLLSKSSSDKTEVIDNPDALKTDVKETKSFIKDILGKVSKAETVELTGKTKNSKAVDLRINSDLHPALANTNFSKKKAAGLNQYQREVNSINQSLVKSPVHSELIINNKLQDENGISNLHSSGSEQAMQAIDSIQGNDLSQGSDGQNENFSSQKVLDLSQIKAESKSSLIKEVSNYIEQSYVSNQESVDLLVKHDELGSFRIHAQKTGVGGQVDLEINTASKQAELFFHENESELIKNLQSGGVKLSSVKIVAKAEFLFTMEGGKSGNMEQSLDSGRQQSFHGRGEQRSQSSSQNFSDGRDRREELWQQAQDFNKKYAA